MTHFVYTIESTIPVPPEKKRKVVNYLKGLPATNVAWNDDQLSFDSGEKATDTFDRRVIALVRSQLGSPLNEKVSFGRVKP